VADATGLEPADVVSALREGHTLNDILAEHGADPQVVIDAVTAEVTEELTQAVTDGRITEERKATVLENLPDALDRALNFVLPTPIRDRAQERFENTLVGVLAEMAGVEPGELLRDALTPPSLAEIAASYGLDPDAIITETETRITVEINQRVADGEMSQEDAAEILDGLHDRLVERFNAPLLRVRPDVARDRVPGLRGRFF
jgi:hypothetical protein